MISNKFSLKNVSSRLQFFHPHAHPLIKANRNTWVTTRQRRRPHVLSTTVSPYWNHHEKIEQKPSELSLILDRKSPRSPIRLFSGRFSFSLFIRTLHLLPSRDTSMFILPSCDSAVLAVRLGLRRPADKPEPSCRYCPTVARVDPNRRMPVPFRLILRTPTHRKHGAFRAGMPCARAPVFLIILLQQSNVQFIMYN